MQGDGGRPAGRGLGRRFWTVWAAGTVSFLGDGVSAGAVPLLTVSLTQDPRLVALVDACAALGWLLLGLPSGVVVDRVDRLTLMWRVDVVRCAIAAGFAVLVLGGRVGLGMLLGVSLLLGLAAPFFDNAHSSVLPELVPGPELERANSLTQGSLLLSANLLGPPLGALSFVAASGAPFVANAVSFALGAGLVATCVHRRRAGAARPATAGVRAQLREGLAYLAGHRVLRTLSLVIGVVNAVSGAIFAVLVLYVIDELGLPEAAYGAMVATFAVGGVVGSVVTPWAIRRFGPRACALAPLVGFGAAALTLAVAKSVVVVVLASALAGGLSILWNVVALSYRQREVPGELLGRVTSVYRMVAFVGMPAGAVGAGVLAHAVGIRATYAAGGMLLLLTALLSIAPLRHLPTRDAGAVPG